MANRELFLAGALEIDSGEHGQCPESDVVEGVAGGRAAVDGTKDGLNDGTGIAQGTGCVANRAAGGDDVLHKGDPFPRHVGPFGEAPGPVLLGLLTDEECGYTGEAAEHRGQRNATEFKTADELAVRGNHRPHGLGHTTQQMGIGLEEVLVEVLDSCPP